MGVSALRIESGRYEANGTCGRHGVPVNMRVCQVCSLLKVEDEIHFLLECPTYSDLRCKLLNVARSSLALDVDLLSIEGKFQAIMSTRCIVLCWALGEFVWAAFARRRRHLKLILMLSHRKNSCHSGAITESAVKV